MGVVFLRPWYASQLTIRLIDALDENDSRQVRWLLTLGADINAVDPSTGTSPLQEAVSSGSDTLALLLNRQDLQLHPARGQGMDPLIIALSLDEPSTVRELLVAEARLAQAPSNPEAALARAVVRGNVQDASRMLRAGVSPDAHDPGWPTPLCLAVLFEHVEMVSLLLRQGANPNGSPINCDANPEFEGRPLVKAAEYRLPELVGLLLDAGARLDAPLPCAGGPVTAAVSSGNRQCIQVFLTHPRAGEISRLDLRAALSIARVRNDGPVINALRLRLASR